MRSESLGHDRNLCIDVVDGDVDFYRDQFDNPCSVALLLRPGLTLPGMVGHESITLRDNQVVTEARDQFVGI